MDHPPVLPATSEIPVGAATTTRSAGFARPQPHRQSSGSGWSLSTWLLLLLGLLLIPAGIYSGWNLSRWTTDARPVDDGKGVLSGVAMALVDVQGGVRSLYPTRPGKVIATPHEEGEEVEAGTVLLVTDDWLAVRQRDEAKTDLLAAEQKLEQARVAQAQHEDHLKLQEAALAVARKKHQTAQAQLDKVRRYVNEGIQGSQEDVIAATRMVEEAETGIEVEKVRLRVLESSRPDLNVRLAEANVQAKKQQLDRAEQAIKEHAVVAPSKGRILRRLAHVGEVLGNNPLRPAIEFAAGEVVVRAEFEQEFASDLEVGQPIEIYDYVNHSDQLLARGKITQLSNWYAQRRVILFEPTQINDVRTREVIIGQIELVDSRRPLLINQRLRVQKPRSEDPIRQAESPAATK